MIGPTRTGLLLMLCCFLGCSLRAQVSFDRLVRAPQEPQNWLTYSGSYLSQRYSPLQQIDLANVKNLELQWVFQAQSLQKFEVHAAGGRRDHVRHAAAE